MKPNSLRARLPVANKKLLNSCEIRIEVDLSNLVEELETWAEQKHYPEQFDCCFAAPAQIQISAPEAYFKAG